MQQKCTVKSKQLYFGVVDLEKSFDWIQRAMHKLGVDEWLVSAIMSANMSARTIVRTVHGNSDNFEAKVGIYQDSALSSFFNSAGSYIQS